MSDRGESVRWRWRFLVLSLLMAILRRIIWGIGYEDVVEPNGSFEQEIASLKKAVERGDP